MTTKTLKSILFMSGMLAFAGFYHLSTKGSACLMFCSLSAYSFLITILALYLLVSHIKPQPKDKHEETKQ